MKNALIILWAAPALACDLLPAGTLTAERPAPGDEFGGAVSLSSDVAVIGARNDDHAATDAGAAHVFRFDGRAWILEQVLTATDAQNSDALGSVVAVDGGVAVIGAPGDDDAGGAAGAAYVFRYDGNNWIEEIKLLPSDPLPGDSFGAAVAVHGDVIAVGAPHSDLPLTNAGSVCVFRFDGTAWNFEQRLQASDAEAADRFGIAVAVGEAGVLVGSYLEDSACPADPSCNSGAVYVFEHRDAVWLEEDKLIPSDTALFDHFGCFVALDGAAALIGAYHDSDAGSSSGSAYVYRRSGSGSWLEEQKLVAADAAGGDRFGWRGAIAGGRAIVGAPGRETNRGSDAGMAYLFRSDGALWSEVARLLGPPGSGGQELGDVLALGDNTVLAGVFRDDAGGALSGSVRRYDLSPDVDADGVPDACDGCTAMADCADQDHNGVSDDGCLWYSCAAACTAQPRAFADLGGQLGSCAPDGVADANDRFHALNCFTNLDTTGRSGYPCELAGPQAFNVDAGGPFGSCAPDGVCDGHDAFHALNAFAGLSTCTCRDPSPVPPAPDLRARVRPIWERNDR